MVLFHMAGTKTYLLKKWQKVGLWPPPQTKVYCSPFAGTCIDLFFKPRSPLEVMGDTNQYIVNVFRCCQNRETYRELLHLCKWSIDSEGEFIRAMEILRSNESSDVERAWAWMIHCEMCWRGVHREHFTIGERHTTRNLSRLLWKYRQRLRGVKIFQQDAFVLMERVNSPDTFFYLDPPYLNCRNQLYGVNVTREWHRELLERVRELKGMVWLCGYPDAMYEKYLKGWHRYSFSVVCHMAGRKKGQKRDKREEVVWLNYEPHKVINPAFGIETARLQKWAEKNL